MIKACAGMHDDGIADGNLTRCSKSSGCGDTGCPSNEDVALHVKEASRASSNLKVTRNAGERAAGTERPRLSLQQYNAAVWKTRATDYGADKYARGNYHRQPPAGVEPIAQIVEYLDAALRHLGKVAQAVNVAYGTGGNVGEALACVDDESSAGFPPSMLPQLAHALSGLSIMVEIGVQSGLMPADPGQPWKHHPMYAEVLARRGGAAPSALPQKDDLDAEHARRPLSPGDTWCDATGRRYEVVHIADVGSRPRWWLSPGVYPDGVGLRDRRDLHTYPRPSTGATLVLVEANPC